MIDIFFENRNLIKIFNSEWTKLIFSYKNYEKKNII